MAAGGHPIPARTNCLIVGAYKSPESFVFPVGSQARQKQRRMKYSIEEDMTRVLEFAAKNRGRVRQQVAARHPPKGRVFVSEIWLNDDMRVPLERGLKSRHRREDPERKVLDQAIIQPYTTKEEVREGIRVFLSSASEDQHLLLFMTGHGSLQQEPHIQQAFSIATPRDYDDELYTDEELTEDINDSLPNGQRLYIVMNSCYSGGMLNLWEIDASEKWVALFASAGPTLKSDWSTLKEDDDEDEDDEDEHGYDFVSSFFKHAHVKRPLMEIAEQVLFDKADIDSELRPAFVTTKPTIAGQLFLG